MTHSLRFLPEVTEDLLAAFEWYEAQAESLGEEFLRMFYACAGEIPENPLRYPTIHREYRRRLMRRFPYAIYFTVRGTEIVTLGVFHCARDPRGTKTILRERRDPKEP